MKQQIRQKLVAAMVVDLCAHSEGLIFRDAWCTQERVIRFTTPFFRELLPVGADGSGRWKTGDFVMYEIQNGSDAFSIDCVLSGLAVTVEKRNALLKAAGVKNTPLSADLVLRHWDLTGADGDVNRRMADFSRFLEEELPRFEQQLRERLAEQAPPEPLTEGAAETVTSNQYERNPKARAACIAAHGTACAVCGIDFGDAYGPEFAGKIEVHHIVPLSEIGEAYVVDPVRDLRPVCPNCHTALHSKKGGVYTIEELKAIRGKSHS